MRWSKPGIGPAAVALFWAMAIAGAVPGQQLTVYTAQASYSLPVFDRGGKAYIAVADLLSPLGASAPHLKGKEWKLELNNAEARFTAGKDKAAIRGQQADLGGKALVEDGRVIVPLAAALPLLSRLLNTTVDFHQPSRRIFVGNVFTHFTAEFKDGETPSLVLNFSQPLKRLDTNHEEDRNGLLFTHANKTTLTFRKDPLISDVNKQQFGDGAIQALTFTEENGIASITVTGSKPLQIGRSEDGKTITLQPEAPAATAGPEPSQQGTPAAPESQRRAPDFFVMIDPSHGGNDKGASFGGRLVEKDITLRLARELRKELEERGIATRMLRESDIDLSLERRAEITNEQHAGLYVALHAGGPGRGVRVYASFLTDPQQPLAGRFLPWESAQSGALGRSQNIARAVSEELKKKGLTVANLGVPLRPLNNIAIPAIAVELAPESDGPQSLENLKRQNTVASAVAAAIAQIRSQLGGQP
jgi:N-acetylmuramoyl-L-alanine amidase